MAFNLQVFKTRALTAVIFVAVMFAGLFWNKWSFIILFTIIHFGCWYEFIKLMKKIYGDKYLPKALLGLLYITMPVVMMLFLGFYMNFLFETSLDILFYSCLFPCAIIFSIWINDTMAYIVGSFIGRIPFSKISPKKTWEGILGGMLFCIIVIALLGHYLTIAKPIPTKHWIAIAAICAVFGTIGDLLESKIKRMANVKDSGAIMPGHGGFLDRFDSLLIATPFVWIYVMLFIH